MKHIRWIPPAIFLAAGVALASEKDLKEAKAAFEAAIKGTDPLALDRAAAKLARTEPPHGALELVDRGLVHPERRVALAAKAYLAVTGDPLVARALAPRLGDLKEARARRLLAEALATVPGDEVGLALVHALKDRDATVREAAALALGARDRATAAVASNALHEHALRDPSLRVRKAAVSARERLGLGSLPGFDSAPLPNGLPTRFFDGRAIFIVDASSRACEETFLDPGDNHRAPAPAPATPPPGPPKPPVGAPNPGAAPAPPAPPEAPKAPKPPELPPKPVSAYELAARSVASGVLRLEDEQTFDVMTFDVGTKTFAGLKYSRATAKATGDARDWLKETAPGADSRNIALALRSALEAKDQPEEIFIFLAGVPEGRGGETTDAALAQALTAWDRGIPINVVLYELEAPQPPRDEREKLERERAQKQRREFADALANTTGGRTTTIALARAPGKDSAGTKPAGDQDQSRRFKLVGGRVPASELGALVKRLDDGMKSPEAAAKVRDLVAELAASQDEPTAELALKPLLQGPVELRLASVEGFSKNPSPRVLAWLAQELRVQTDSGKAMGLARAIAAIPGIDAARAIAAEAERREGSGDLPRFLLKAISRRPVAEVAAITSELARALRHPRTGLAAAYVKRTLGLLQHMSLDWPGTPEDRLLPERFQAAGVAFLVDAEAAMNAPFATPPAESPPAPREPHKKPEDKKAAPSPLPSPAPPAPVSRREVATREVRRALEALSESHASANVLSLADASSWKPRVTALTTKTLPEAKDFVGTLSGGARNALRPIERALEDPDLEEIWVIAAGLPVRSDGDADAAAAHEKLRSLAFRRGISVNVVLALGETGPQDPALAAATRKDELTELKAFWGPIAKDADGSLLVRERCKLTEEPRPGKTPHAPSAPAGGGR